MKSSEYIEKERRTYALYVLQHRSIPSVIDGLKSAGRRVLWMGRNGEKYKTATLAGITMAIHPHASPESSINTLAAPYGNNIPLFNGYGAFGTLLSPTAYGAARYTSVSVSEFTKDVLFRDIEIIPMISNYDDTQEEPKHFLPLVPVVLLNPCEGVAVGFATNILPRSLDSIITHQIAYLSSKKPRKSLLPNFTPTSNVAVSSKDESYFFEGDYTSVNASQIVITKIPYGQTHERVIAKIDSLMETGTVVDCTDNSKNNIEIHVKFKKGTLSNPAMTRDKVLTMLGLTCKAIENLNVIDFNGTGVWSPTAEHLITTFTEWRLQWYVTRYQRLQVLNSLKAQKHRDICIAVENNVGDKARTIRNKSKLKEYLQTIGIVNLDFIADLPIYRFTEEDRLGNEEKLNEAIKMSQHYDQLLSSHDMRKEVYLNELSEILDKYKHNAYQAIQLKK